MPTTYRTPGVHVHLIPSGIQPIAGVGTTTAAFIGLSAGVPAGDKLTDKVLGRPFDEIAYIKPDGPMLLDAEPASDRLVVSVDGRTAKVTNIGPATSPVAAAVVGTTALVLPKYQVTFEQVDPKNKDAAQSLVRAAGFWKVAEGSVSKAGEVKLCTSFTEYTTQFGGFTPLDTEINRLAHAVYGFFENGGTRCYVSWITKPEQLDAVLQQFDGLDDIAMIAVPGITDPAVQGKIIARCAKNLRWFALFDTALDPRKKDGDEIGVSQVVQALSGGATVPPPTENAAVYFPWIRVADPFQSVLFVPPSGHVAGLIARVDNERGVHKAPANEPLFGALDLRYKLSAAHQEGLNPQGINCIREINRGIRVWGARTVGGDANGEWKSVSVRRLFLFLRRSLEEGLAWAVFEPNDRSLWAKITRNVTAFLTNVWRTGALFGATPQEAFYVKCDASTNPREVREAGQVVTEIGVAAVQPAEFVVVRLSQWSGPSGKP